MSSQFENVGIFWDYENCEVPVLADGYTVASSIRRIGHQYGTIKAFKAYARLSEQSAPRTMALRSELSTCGVTFIDCPHNGWKDVADKMLLVDMMAFAMDNPAPATIVLISGDRDFVHAVAQLRLRRYQVVIIAPPHNMHSSLRMQASEFYDWCQDILPLEMRTTTPSSNHSRNASNARPRSSSALTPRSLRPTAVSFVPSSPGYVKSNPLAESPTSHRRRQSETKHDSPGQGSPVRIVDAVNSGMGFNSFLASISPQIGGKELATLADLKEDAGATESPLQTSSSATDLDHSDDPLMNEPASSDKAPGSSSLRTPLSSNPLTPLTPLEVTKELGMPTTPSPGSSSTKSDLTAEISVAVSHTRAAQYWDIPMKSPSSLASPSPIGSSAFRKAPKEFEPLVKVLERERREGNSTVVSSQLGMQINRNVYERAGTTSLSKYVTLAEQAGIVKSGKHDNEGNRWVALTEMYCRR